mmetsp:Transcript_7658/g.26075  ORF Transcript_7658/g.26075 Transcript_7658/m.26075 type:complete len:202 (-) Transcript_7658:475-1080(-)
MSKSHFHRLHISAAHRRVRASTVSTSKAIAYRAPTKAPWLVPPTMSTGTLASWSARRTPTWAKPRAPPPPRTRPMAVPVRMRARRARSRNSPLHTLWQHVGLRCWSHADIGVATRAATRADLRSELWTNMAWILTADTWRAQAASATLSLAAPTTESAARPAASGSMERSTSVPPRRRRRRWPSSSRWVLEMRPRRALSCW